MIFNIKIKTVSKAPKYVKNCAELFFCNSNVDFDKIVKSKEVKLNQLQGKNFKNDKSGELFHWTENDPSVFIIKKISMDENINVDFFRNYLSGLIQYFDKHNISNVFINIPEYDAFQKIFDDESYFYQSMVEGLLLGSYNFDVYKADKKKAKTLNVTCISDNLSKFKKSVSKAESVINGVVFTRDLVNEPANTLTPAEYAKRVKSEFKGTEVSVKVFDEKELEKRKMNAILSVGKASTNLPRLIIAHYKPKTKAKKKIVLVGKGVTYDTGGLSIKPTNGMLEMKADMAGSAAVFGIIKSAYLLNYPIEILGIVPAVENAISGNAYKPGDVISTASGKTIEVKDTDAEGRIVLADALEYASAQKPDEIIDFATLTGAVAVALGLFTAGIFTKNERMSKDLLEAGKITYEHTWRLPFWDEYNKLIESKIADVSNLGPRWGGAITAGKFLEHFVEKKIPWTHIDLAGPALSHDLTNYTKDYCTGYGVRLIAKYLEKI